MVNDILERAEKRADALFSHGRELAKAHESVNPVTALNIGGGRTSLLDTNNGSVHENQYRHAKKGWSFAAIRPAANRLAGQELKVASVTSDNSERAAQSWQRDLMPDWTKGIRHDIEILDTHPLLETVCHPNPFMVQWQLAWATAFSLQATGKAYWWFIPRKDGKVDVWFVPAHWIRPDKDKPAREGWIIQPNSQVDGVKVDGKRIAFFSYPDVMNPFGSVSTLAAADRTIKSDDAIHEAQWRGFQGGHMPDHAFIMGEKIGADGNKQRPEIGEDQRREMEQRFRQLYSGPKNHGRFIILDRLIEDVKRLSLAPTEMDYQNSMKLTKSEIMQTFGVNPVIAGEIENANRASATIADETFILNVVGPMSTLMGQVLTEFIVRTDAYDSSNKVIVFYEEARAIDPEQEAENHKWAYDRAIIDDNTFRTRVLRLPPKMTGGDTARINGMLVDVPVEPDSRQRSNRVTVSKGVIKGIWLKSHESSEQRFDSDMRDYFRRQAEDIARNARGEAAIAQTIFRPLDFDDELKETASRHVLGIAARGASFESGLFKAHTKQTFDELPPRVAFGIRDFVSELFDQPFWSDINQNVLRDLERIIADGAARGLSPEQLARHIESQLTEMSIGRALRIARTETTGAMNAGAYAVRQDLAAVGSVAGAEWSTTVDQFTRGNDANDHFDHIKVDGQQVGIGIEFDVDGESAPYPAHFSLSAANRVNCRCVALSVTTADLGSESPNGSLDIEFIDFFPQNRARIGGPCDCRVP